MLTLGDLGLPDPGRVVPETKKQERTALPVTGALEPGSVASRALWEVWRGTPVTVVSSPPGAGKSTLVAELVDRLVSDAKLNVMVAAPTVAMCKALAIRFADRMPESHVVLRGTAFAKASGIGANVLTDADKITTSDDTMSVAVRTLASCSISQPTCDVLVVDEAYQATTAQVAAAARYADQILMVGDPGQIPPVVTVDTTPWEGLPEAPHVRAPEGFLTREDAVHLHLPSTYRLGPDTTRIVNMLYDFDFTSQRPPVTMTRRGEQVEEISTLVLPPSDTLSDLSGMQAVAHAAASLVGTRATFQGGSATIVEEDVVVVAARNEQVTAITAVLAQRGLSGIKVGTADRLQGGQWPAVVALDPLYGAPGVSDHSASLGRLCVMLSRAFAHLTWVTDSGALDRVSQTGSLEGEDRDRHAQVRSELLAFATAPHTVAA